MFRRLRLWFFAGLAIVIPVALTVVALKWLYDFLDGWIHPVLETLGLPVPPGLGAGITILLTLIAGFLASNLLGRRFLSWAQNVLLSLPVVRKIYGTVKQLTDAMFFADSQAFKGVCLVEWPRAEMYIIGFVTGYHADAAGNRLTAIFVPPAPNPTAGWVLLLPEPEVRMLNMSVEEALKVVISGGVYTPDAAGQAAVLAAAAELKALRGGNHP